MDDDKGHVDEPSTMLSAATKEGSDIPTGTVHPEVEAVCETVMTRAADIYTNRRMYEYNPRHLGI